MPIRLWGVNMPTRPDLPAAPHGVVLHWTGGSPVANNVDLEAYHYVVDHDGKLRPGHWPVAANMRNLHDDSYAHHTGGFNSYRVGISGAGMMGYQSPRSPGIHLLTEMQVNVMCQVAAYFVWMAGLDPHLPTSMCTHQEVWTRLGVKGQHNHEKKDIEYLQFRPHLSPAQVGEYLRGVAYDYIHRVLDPGDEELPVLRPGANGVHVARVQHMLGVRGPDVFGPLTRAAVISFQSENGLVADGIVGHATWRALINEENRKRL